MVISHIHVV